ncbi:MAG: hypothetical protein NTV33_04175 [Coprothermobacterota bacterium]|nr:hypothetical protein [Coprothermobacterota bacterium]
MSKSEAWPLAIPFPVEQETRKAGHSIQTKRAEGSFSSRVGKTIRWQTISGIIGFLGTAAPQCGICSNKTEADRSGKPALWGGSLAAICPTSTQNTLPGAIQL